jgi:hypothetical protein
VEHYLFMPSWLLLLLWGILAALALHLTGAPKAGRAFPVESLKATKNSV